MALVHELPSVAGGGSGHGTVASERNYEEPLLRADRLVVVSDHGRKVLLGRGVSPGRIHVVPPGFDGVPVGYGSPARGDGPVRALCVAQWIERKGILTLVEAWTLRERKGAVLELIGGDRGRPRLRSPGQGRHRSRTSGLHRRIGVSGRRVARCLLRVGRPFRSALALRGIRDCLRRSTRLWAADNRL